VGARGIGGGLGEVVAAGGGDADLEVPVVEAVEVFLEDAVLAPRALDAESEPHLGELAAHGARGGVGDLDELLRDRGGARLRATAARGPRGTGEGAWIDAVVSPETAVLGAHGGGDQLR
jgi:hypothetical protein